MNASVLYPLFKLISMSQNKILARLVDCTLLYERKLANNNLLFIYGNVKYPKHIETEFLPSNLMHLTGTEIINGSASVFYKNILENKLSPDDINIKYDTLTFRKLDVLYSLLNFESSAKAIGIYNDSQLSLKSDKFVGNERGCIGFVKDQDNLANKFYYPNTALNINIKEVVDIEERVLAVLKKSQEEEKYNELCYVAKGISLRNIHFSNEISKMFDICNIYEQEALRNENEYRKTLTAIYKTSLKKECSELRKELIRQDIGIKTIENTVLNKRNSLQAQYTYAVEQSISMYHEVNADNVIYFDQRDETIFEQVKAFYDSQPQSKIDKILENINSLPKGLNPEGKLDILRNNGIKHSSEMEPEERKAAFEKEEVITPKFGGNDI